MVPHCGDEPSFMNRQIAKQNLISIPFVFAATAAALLTAAAANAATTASTNAPAWITRPLSLAESLNVALQQNGTILKARSDLEASHGVVVQTRAIVIPRVQASGNFTYSDPNAIDKFPFAGGGGTNASAFTFQQPHENWSSGIQIVQSI